MQTDSRICNARLQLFRGLDLVDGLLTAHPGRETPPMYSRIYKKYSLLIRAGLAVALVVIFKLAAHALDWEVLSLNPLFSGLVAANVFLMGFLLSGVLSDFKESERLPGEVASTLETLMDEASAVQARHDTTTAQAFSAQIMNLADAIHDWLFERTDVRSVLDRLAGLNTFFLALEPVTQPNFIVRMKQEHQTLRRTLIRIDTIRETSFTSSGYIIAEASTLLLSLALVLTRIEPFYESLFMVGAIVFLLTFLIVLIRDLDNPFGYSDRSSTEDVSLRPLEDFIDRMRAAAADERSPSDRRVRVGSVVVDPPNGDATSTRSLRGESAS
jgi:hypothetical protein